MKWLFYLSCFLFTGINGLSAQLSVDSIPAPGTYPLFNQDSLYQVQLLQRARMAEEMTKADIRYFVIRVPDEKFGYTIFIDGTLYIEQNTIPAVQGKGGFKTIEDAEKVAKLVIEKIKLGEMPPTILIEDLKHLDVIE
jgi:hypothetical protein